MNNEEYFKGWTREGNRCQVRMSDVVAVERIQVNNTMRFYLRGGEILGCLLSDWSLGQESGWGSGLFCREKS